MGTNAITGVSGIQSYYKSHEIPIKTPEEIKEKEQPPEQQPIRESDGGLQADTPANPENISLTFHKEETFDYIGSESRLDNLDVRKAISDMQKDAVLEEYQYFVGSAKPLINTEDGIVLMK